jgi:hypothetical protein
MGHLVVGCPVIQHRLNAITESGGRLGTFKLHQFEDVQHVVLVNLRNGRLPNVSLILQSGEVMRRGDDEAMGQPSQHVRRNGGCRIGPGNGGVGGDWRFKGGEVGIEGVASMASARPKAPCW